MIRLLATGFALLVLLALPSGMQAVHRSLSCADCHISHGERTSDGRGTDPIWNTSRSTQTTFSVYRSATFDAKNTDIGQPDGASRLCLGCHDGSHDLLGGPSFGRARFGAADLARSHPVSFTYDSSLAMRSKSNGLKDPQNAQSGLGGTIARDLLDAGGKMQCSSCHDMHVTGKGKYMLRYDYNPSLGTDKDFCRVCHNR